MKRNTFFLIGFGLLAILAAAVVTSNQKQNQPVVERKTLAPTQVATPPVEQELNDMQKVELAKLEQWKPTTSEPLASIDEYYDAWAVAHNFAAMTSDFGTHTRKPAAAKLEQRRAEEFLETAVHAAHLFAEVKAKTETTDEVRSALLNGLSNGLSAVETSGAKIENAKTSKDEVNAFIERFAFKTTGTMAPTARPAWVQKQIEWFDGEDYSKHRVAFQRPFAWGRGWYGSTEFLWFSHSNTDAYLQFNVNQNLLIPNEDQKKLKDLVDKWNRPWEVAWVPADKRDYYGTGTATWFGSSNDWTDATCTNEYKVCDGKKAIDLSVAQMNKSGLLKLEVAEYLH